jgi:hypothetical protein
VLARRSELTAQDDDLPEDRILLFKTAEHKNVSSKAPSIGAENLA